MGNHKINMLVVGALLLLGSCVEDELHDTSNPTLGTVQVTIDWAGHSTEAILPARYTLRVGIEEREASGTENNLNTLLPPGIYSLLAYNTPAGITVNGNTAIVGTLPDGTLEPMPGYLFSATKMLMVAADKTQQVTLPMKQRVRQLILGLMYADPDSRVARVTATLGGIASSIDLTTGAVTARGGETVIPVFTLAEASKAKSNGTRVVTGMARQEATVRLVDVMATARQELILLVTLKDGTVQTVITDLTAFLKNFTGGSMEPLKLDATMELPVAAGTSATITGWTVVDNGNVDIH